MNYDSNVGTAKNSKNYSYNYKKTNMNSKGNSKNCSNNNIKTN